MKDTKEKIEMTQEDINEIMSVTLAPEQAEQVAQIDKQMDTLTDTAVEGMEWHEINDKDHFIKALRQKAETNGTAELARHKFDICLQAYCREYAEKYLEQQPDLHAVERDGKRFWVSTEYLRSEERV